MVRVDRRVSRADRGLSAAWRFVVFAACCSFLAGTAAAAPEPMRGATVVGVTGEAQIERAGAWVPVEDGTTVAVGEEVRTGASGQLLLLLSDASLLTIGTQSRVVVGSPARGSVQAGVAAVLEQGSVGAVVSHREAPGFTVETPTALVRATGTKFVITYDPAAEVSEVVGVSGQVEVTNPESRPGGDRAPPGSRPPETAEELRVGTRRVVEYAGASDAESWHHAHGRTGVPGTGWPMRIGFLDATKVGSAAGRVGTA